MSIGFESPGVLPGLAAVAVPVAIHLLNKFRVRRVDWGAMRFLRAASRKNQGRLRVEDWVLLLIRCLLVALLVLAFARPVLNPGGPLDSTRAVSKVAVVVLDQSASMGFSDGGRTLLETAKADALGYLDSLGRGSRAALVSTDSRNTPASAKPSPDLVTIRKTIDAAVATGSTADWPSTLAQAFRILKPYQGAGREVVVFTDHQANGWGERDRLRRLMEANPGIPVRVLGPTDGPRANLAVTSLRPEPGVPVAGKPSRFQVEVENFGNEPVEDIPVSLAVDAQAVSASSVLPRLGAGQKSAVVLETAFESPGPHTVTAAIPADRLPADNKRAIPVRVGKEVRIVMVENPVPGRGTFFLSNALVPAPRGEEGDGFLKVDSQPGRWLEDGALDQAAAIFLVNPAKVPASAVERLKAYLEKGGVVFLFPGPATNAAEFNEAFAPVSPAVLADPVGSQSLAWSAGPHTHPVPSFWNGKPESPLSSIVALKFFPMALSREGAVAVVDFSDGSPAVVEGDFHAGKVFVFAAPPDSKWTTLPLNPNFVPFVQRLLAHAMPRPDAEGGVVASGSPFQADLGPAAVGRDLVAESPGAEGRKPAGTVGKGETGGRIFFSNTSLPGAYRLFFQGSDQPVASFAVQVPVAESDLKTLRGNPLDFSTAQPAPPPRAAAPPSVGARLELWAALLGAILALAFLESAMAHVFSLPK